MQGAAYVNRLLRVCLLHYTNSSVRDEDEQDHERLDESRHPGASGLGGVFEAGEHERDDSRGEEDEHELVFELREDELEEGCGWGFGQGCLSV